MATNPERRLRLAFDMFEFGQNMYRLRLKRENPDLTDSAIEELIRTWRLTRPGAEQGDGVGHSSDRFA